MKVKQIIIETIFFIVVLNFFYEGVYKIANFHNFSFWVGHAPLLKVASPVLQYIIPAGEILLSVALLIPAYRINALFAVIIALLLYILWIMAFHFLIQRLCWPFHAFWHKPTWAQKSLFSLGVCWLAFVAVILSDKQQAIKISIFNSLRNTPADVGR